MKKLLPHKVNSPNDYDINVSHRIEGENVIIDFDVKSKVNHVSDEFCAQKLTNWGLWDYDVVEVFIQRKCNFNHYLELQISPKNQKFALLVKTPRIDTQNIEELNSKISSELTQTGFKASFSVNAADIPGTSNDLYANFFACLGPKEDRKYFALNINDDAEPDYHKPELFEYIGTFE